MLVYPDYRSSDLFTTSHLPVGLGYIGKALETAGIEYEVIDLNIDSVDDLMSRLRQFRPEFFGVSMMSYRCKRTYELLHEVKREWPKGKIIVGGPHVTANGERVLMECPAIDVGVVGEGEAALVEIALGSEPIKKNRVTLNSNSVAAAMVDSICSSVSPFFSLFKTSLLPLSTPKVRCVNPACRICSRSFRSK